MTKIIRNGSILIPFLGVILSSVGLATDNSTNINISGRISDNGCVVAATSEVIDVDLLKHATKQLSSPGATTIAVPFKIELSPCGPNASNVKVGFTGTSNSTNDTLLAIDVSSTATGIGVEFLDSNQKTISVNAKPEQLQWIHLIGGEPNTLNFYARLKATSNSVTAGSVKATANFTLEFE
ncbi:fimbrial protein [Serratia ureilytica]|uniref:fimbrial protein n=1 Tax=Serratia ureilytica TaxID=300181 RepID=UPI0034C5F93B